MVASLQVLMPMYNAEAYLAEAIESVLAQSHADFELLIVDDASDDSSVAIARQYAQRDSRLRIIENPNNQGIIETRNQLFDMADADLLAVMDADDICHPERLAKQREFMLANPDIAALGSAVEHFGERGFYYYPPQEHAAIMAVLSLGNAMLNPSVMVRREALNRHAIRCDADYRGAADYDMWLRLGKLATLANLPEPLLRYRNHAVQESSANRTRQQSAHLRIVQRELTLLGIQVDDAILEPLIWPQQFAQTAPIEPVADLVNQLLNCYQQSDSWWSKVDTQELFLMWDFRLRGLCRRQGPRGLMTYLKYRGLGPMSKGKNLGLNFALDCFLRTG